MHVRRRRKLHNCVVVTAELSSLDIYSLQQKQLFIVKMAIFIFSHGR